MDKNIWIGIDLGTTSVKCMAVDADGNRLSVKTMPYQSYSPYSGWVEQEPEEWMAAVYECLRRCRGELKDRHPAAVAFSGHMSSPVFLDRDGEPLRRCITVADTRSHRQSRYLMEHYLERFQNLCGNYPSDCFIAAKLLWLKEEEPANYERTAVFLCAKDYVRYRMTGRMNTDPTDAGNTALYDLLKSRWDMELIRDLGLRADIFPEVLPSLAVVGTTTEAVELETGLRAGTPVVCGGADMACSQLGTGTVEEGCAAITLGTSGQICTGVSSVRREGIGKETFHRGILDGSMYTMATIFSGGLSVNWIYEKMHDKSRMREADFEALGELAREAVRVPAGAGGHMFLPFLTGSASPYFDSRDRACITGLSSASSKPEILRAVLEGVAFHLKENIEVFESMGCSIQKIRLGGGGTKIPLWGKIIADVLGRDLEVLQTSDASVLGACMIARAGVLGRDIRRYVAAETGIREVITCEEREHLCYRELYGLYHELYRAVHAIQVKRFELPAAGRRE